MSKGTKKMKLQPRKGATRKRADLDKVKRIMQKPPMRRIGFELPDNLLNDFKVATSMNGTTMTAIITGWMEDYCTKVRKEQGLDRLSK